MLILTRKLGESITVDDDIKITLLDIKGKQVKIGIDAPKEITVHREEVYQMIKEQNIQASGNNDLAGQELCNIWDRLKKVMSEE